jgi:hypothetical protein
MGVHTPVVKHRRCACCTWDQEKANGVALHPFSLNSVSNGQGFSVQA